MGCLVAVEGFHFFQLNSKPDHTLLHRSTLYPNIVRRLANYYWRMVPTFPPVCNNIAANDKDLDCLVP